MFFLRRPSDARVRELLARQRERSFTYPEVGATREKAPPGYPINHHRARIGEGAGAYDRARAAVRRWAMYDLPWTTLCWPEAPIEPGTTVGVLARHPGFWSLNCARVVYVLDQSGPVERYGFAFGTLPLHAERGEERFTVEIDPRDGSIWYEIYTFAGPRHWLVWLGYPVMRRVQHQFGRESIAAMRAAVAGP